MIASGQRVVVRLPGAPVHTGVIIRDAHYAFGHLVYRVRYDLDGTRVLITTSHVAVS